MADNVRTGKGFQVAVMGGLALGFVVIMGTALTFVHTTTITNAATLLLLGLVLTCVYLLVEL